VIYGHVAEASEQNDTKPTQKKIGLNETKLNKLYEEAAEVSK